MQVVLETTVGVAVVAAGVLLYITVLIIMILHLHTMVSLEVQVVRGVQALQVTLVLEGRVAPLVRLLQP